MSKQVQINRVGDSDVLEIVDVDVPAPSANEVQIAFKVLGLNRAEIMYRRGRYIYKPQFPSKLGYEGAGGRGACRRCRCCRHSSGRCGECDPQLFAHPVWHLR
ncbi:hypothetical protein NHP190003_03130 [Helicobacter sp. NHP19-003]|uniref:Uncharacterized protein n=1 Tax=Helicobacter gastrocanis TaxID=2849641 RepID=A0ABN6I0A5_9HELI|nr:hypothetical protein NHP190003_03130 [Helicobacter sp. NHP19-003]